MFRSILRRPLRSALVAATALTLGVSALQAAEPGDVVAKVGDAEITEADIAFAAQDLGQELRRFPPAQWRTILIDVLVDMKLLAGAARAAGIDKEPDFARQVAFLEMQALRNAYIAREIDAGITEAELKAAYDTEFAGFEGDEEISARHILVASKDEAAELIKKLDEGADFAELATAHSSDGSAAGGGDLGYFTRGQMVPEFEAAAFALAAGEHSKEPVESQFGWHVIKVEDKRQQAAPSFEEVEAGLRQKLIRDIYTKRIGELKAETPVEILAKDAPAEGDAPAAAQ
ncbi:peptidylprolyl isomerase [Polymorphum gilvum]|uniref:Parvulin-like PPIase n=1 Tax=Polymorphum gilvum (strain LMG 25793 / CGMCC 1.9160 / SL003B-26A1) TaxID=991905 RepID=F2J325_POLGS|nr:peptidylprolyl isomerase [Polymorphum gilvum]ADZ68895.1 Peptidyl prolyl cis-trans isomerase D signal peptide protein [Polymorphum gilvum SL003B-26A1]